MENTADEAPGSAVETVKETGEFLFGADTGDRMDEELRALVIGFATGLSIGLAFLVYIVLAEAKLLT